MRLCWFQTSSTLPANCNPVRDTAPDGSFVTRVVRGLVVLAGDLHIMAHDVIVKSKIVRIMKIGAAPWSPGFIGLAVLVIVFVLAVDAIILHLVIIPFAQVVDEQGC
jgi:hypothetical protein